MSFPQRFLSSSPTVQRDYAILGNFPNNNALLSSDDVAELPERDEDDDVGARSDAATDDEFTDGSESLSHMSLPGRRSRQSSRAAPSPRLGPLTEMALSSHSRGNRMANLQPHQPNLGTSYGDAVQAERRFSMFSDDGARSAARLFLGGQHILPPPDADMRSQGELDYATEEALLDADDEPVLQSRSSLHQQNAQTERTPLLEAQRRTRQMSNAHASVISIPATDGGTHIEWQNRPSNWDLRQPAPPNDAQVAEIAGESDVHVHRREISVLCTYSAPIVVTHLLELSLNVVSVFSLGHLGTNELAAASLSSMTANVTGFSILQGFISALDSILPGAYTSHPKMVGLYTQRMLVILAYLLVVICIIWANTEKLLLALGQEPIIASLAAKYLRILTFGIPGYAGFEVCRRYLQAQGLMHAPTIVLIVVSPINAFLNWLLVWGPEPMRLGFIGAPIASATSMWLMFVLGAVQCYIAPRIAWGGWSRLAFTGLGPILQLGWASTLAMGAEWWSWEIVGLVCSRLGTVALAAQSVLLVSSSISYQLPYGISVAAAVRVGNLLGASQPQQAKISSNMAIFLSMAASAVNSAAFMLIRNSLGALYSSDAEVIRMVSEIVPLIALFQFSDSVCGVTAGILRGVGRQKYGAIINLTGYYIFGIPIGFFLTFGPPQWGLSGLWTGLTIALTYAAALQWIILVKTDWHLEMQRVLSRMTGVSEHDQVENGGDIPGAAKLPAQQETEQET